MSRSLKFAFVVTAWFTLPTDSTLGCVNGPDSPVTVGQPIYTETLEPQYYIQKLLSGHLSPQDWEFALADATDAKSRGAISFDENSIAVALIHLGRTSEALKILEKLEKKSPGSYYTAANLGSAYELIGDNEKAYQWIAEGMKRNPASHFGTEWLHLKILKAKQELKKDPKWNDTNSVLGINWDSVEGDLSKIQVTADGEQVYNAETVRKAIEYQLHERTEFVKPPDPTVASLLYDLSRLVRHLRSAEHGDVVLSAAYTYGYPRPAEASTPATAPQQNESVPIMMRPFFWLPAGLIAVILIGVALAAFRQKNRKRRQTK